MRRRALIATGLLIALLSALGGVGGEGRGPQDALAAALPRVEQQQVCAGVGEAGQALHHAGLVVVFPDGTDTFCIEFTEDELSGAELLQRTGLPLVLSGFGGLGSGVCRIDNVGCSDPGNCFCQCQGADCHYWTYYELDGEAWRFLPVGASQRRVQDGAVDGWVWGNGHTPPGAASIGKLCAAVRPTPAPTATPVPTNRGTRTTATPPPNGPPANDDGTVGLDARTQVADGEAMTPEPTRVSALEGTLGPTVAPRVVRRSDRPSSDGTGAEDNGASDEGGGLPVGLLAFGGVAGALIVVGGGFVVRRRLRG